MSDILSASGEKKPAGIDRLPEQADIRSWGADPAFGGRKPRGGMASERRLTDDQAFAELRRRQLDRSR